MLTLMRRPAAGRGPAATGPQAGQNVREMAGADGQQAVRLLRQRAAEFGVLPNRIGIIGYSAGGAVVLSTVYGPADGKTRFRGPDLCRRREFESAAAGSPAAVHRGSGGRPDVGYQGSIDLFAAWRKAGLPAELHVFQTGQHGFGKGRRRGSLPGPG